MWISRRKRLNPAGGSPGGHSVDAAVHRQPFRMHPLVGDGHKRVFGNLVFDFEARLFGVGILEFLGGIAERELKERSVGSRVDTVVSKVAERRSGEHRSRNADRTGGSCSDQESGWIGEVPE